MSYIPLVETVVKALVDQPDQVQVDEELVGHTRTFYVKVAPEDVGKVIGKSGRVVSAVRGFVSAVASKSKEKAFVRIVTPEDE